MNPAFMEIYCLLNKTVHLEIPTSTYGTVKHFVDFPVSCDGQERNHPWEFVWSASRESCDEEGDPTHYFTYVFSLLLKPKDHFNYIRGFYKIKISGNVNSHDEVLVEGANDFPGPYYNRVEYNTDVNRTRYNIQSVKVEVTLQSYPVESPTLTPLKWFLENGSLTDVVIKTKDKDFPCHKLVLASVSEYFRNKFGEDLEDNESVVNWVGVYDTDVVQDFLHYVYTGQTPPNLAETSSALLVVAHVCRMVGLDVLCARHLKSTITVDNMGDILKAAVKYESQELQEIAINFIVRNYDLQGGSPPPWEKLESDLGSLAIGMFKAMITKRMLF